MRNASLYMESTLPYNITWKQVNWKQICGYVEKLQQRIYRAESLGMKRKVRELQRLLMHSKSALLLSIRRVTQKNKGKKTPGVDGHVVLSDKERIELYQKMIPYKIGNHTPKPSCRTYIKKKNGKLRPLSIPTIKDRIYQNIAKMALEPQWEVRFEPTSYGFRPKRGCHDAVERIFKNCCNGRKKQWIFEGDFKGCFDNLNHDYIMEQIREFPEGKVIGRWLKAGYVDNGVFSKTERGSGQGSIISPLLANIALHGMEEQLGIAYRISRRKTGEQSIYNKSKYAMVRYADDFVCMCESRQDVEAVFEILKPYLESRGLELEPSKTRIVNIKDGFDFLSFNIRKYGTSNGDKVLIKPSKESVQKSMHQISDKVRELTGNNVGKLIDTLNPIITGKANYWSPMVSKGTYSKMDNHIYGVTRKFLKRLHPKKSAGWINKKYYRTDMTGKSGNQWILTDTVKNKQLKIMAQKAIKRHVMIKHNASPYDATLTEYFKKRDMRYELRFKQDN